VITVVSVFVGKSVEDVWWILFCHFHSALGCCDGCHVHTDRQSDCLIFARRHCKSLWYEQVSYFTNSSALFIFDKSLN